VEYGPPLILFVIVVAIATLLAVKVGSSTTEALGWLVFIALFIAGANGAYALCKDRVVFRRIYRTR
jgi:hypothetical protein